ncbi:polymer-forming cytoskeletal protein [Paenibacillus enshidis]|uniref:Polymer-forming cytoskeletal protein n=1 Tax=Paenibacillus enshidis TaxID=1458439 RepID=A0ABV5AS39_9BACL
MFKSSPKPTKPAPARSTDTLLSTSAFFEGKLQCEAPLRIEGRYQGEINSTSVVFIGESSVIIANITAPEVIIAGKVFGDIYADNRVTLTSTGELYGNTACGVIVIMEGGVLNGLCQMKSKADSPPGDLAGSRNESQSANPAAGTG